MKIIRLPYSDNITTIFNTIASYPWSIWLDSGAAKTFGQRYDIITAFPYKTYTSNLDDTTIEYWQYSVTDQKLVIKSTKKEQIHHSASNTNPLAIINAALSELAAKDPQHQQATYDIPFWHGAMGYFGYDLNQLLFSKLQKNQQTQDIPLCAVGFYAWALIYDHHLKQVVLAYDQRFIKKGLINSILEILSCEDNENILYKNRKLQKIINHQFHGKKFTCTIDKQQYINGFQQIKKHIINGDCYQINYALPFELNFKQEKQTEGLASWHIYQYLKLSNTNPFGCYFKLSDNKTIMSFSPERFLKLSDDVVTAEPIKGTRIHSDNHASDRANKKDLTTSVKDRAENIMIVDLMRNDLNKACIPGSVTVKQICGLHTFPTVHHLISTITGINDKSKNTAMDVFKHCFPGGSITGAPKLRSMQIIQQLENDHDELTRYIYCGSIGYFNIDGGMDTNIAIRTAVHTRNSIKYWAGSGIVADSESELEHQEIYNKLIKIPHLEIDSTV